jgi:hypothetical protein
MTNQEREIAQKATESIRSRPVIYRLDENNEATGETLRFCDEDCRNHYLVNIEDVEPAGFGEESTDIPDGWQCDSCGITLESVAAQFNPPGWDSVEV